MAKKGSMAVDQYLIAVAVSVMVAAVLLMLMTKEQRDALLDYGMSCMPTVTRQRRISSSKTPPRSVSPEKKVPNNGAPSVDYQDIFPPSPRELMAQWAEQIPPTPPKSLHAGHVDPAAFRKGLIPFAADYRECGPSTYTPTQFSVEEIKALGDFPDYAELSGVPRPEAYTQFTIKTARARPYRPFRWAYHQTMSLTKLEPDWWLEVEQTYATRVAERKKIFAEHGKLVLNYLPGSELGCKETMEMCLQFLCARYPHYFRLSHTPQQGYVFHNGILNNETVINRMHPLHVLLENVPEDFAVMIRNPADGCYYFQAGVICSALGWNVDTKLGMQLKDIHGPIPDYKEKMEFSMDRYFSKLPTSRPIQRGSWGLEVDTPLFMPPNDPHEVHRLSQSPSLVLPRVHLRVDWQTLRRLPLSGAIIFNFKALFTPLQEFRDEAYIPALLVKVLHEGKESMMRYKNTWHVEHVAIPALEAWAREQVEAGQVPADWEVHTLAESPWFPGWEEKWKRQQGF